MTEELPEIFDRLTPQSAPPQLRVRVLAAIEGELARRKKPRWERALELGVAACLVLGVGLNAWQWRANESWQSRDYAPPVAAGRQDLVDTVASITDEATAQMLVDRLVSARWPRRGPDRPLAGNANDSVKN